MQNQRGNFLLQVLLALTLVFSFMPFLAKKLANRDMAAQMYSAKQSVETVYNAARLYLYDNKDKLPDATVLEDSDLVTALGPYGLPRGFNPETSLGQKITFTIDVKEVEQETCPELGEECYDDEAPEYLRPVIQAVVHVKPKKNVSLKEYQVAELARMIGFFAKPSGTEINVPVPVDVMYTDVVLRQEVDGNVGFLTELQMGDNENKYDIDMVGALFAESGDFNKAQFTNLYITGNHVDNSPIKIPMNANKFYFKTSDNTAPLSINSIADNTLTIGSNIASGQVNAGSVLSNPKLYAHTLETVSPSIGEFVSNEGCNWTVANNLIINPDAKGEFSVTTLEVKKGDLYGAPTSDLDNFKFNKDSGITIDSGFIYSPKITLVGAKMIEIANKGVTDNVQIELALSGTSTLPDINVGFKTDDRGKIILTEGNVIIADPTSKDNNFVACNGLLPDVHYSKTSLSRAIICSYIFWERLERRMNVKICQLEARQCIPK